MSTKVSFDENVSHHLSAGFQILLISTAEEARCQRELQRVAKAHKLKMATWDELNGFTPGEGKIFNPVTALQKVPEAATFPSRETLVVFRDLHNHFHKPDVRRILRESFFENKFNREELRRPVVLLQPTNFIHPDLAACVTMLEFDLPDNDYLGRLYDETAAKVDEAHNFSTPALRHSILQSLRGLTESEAVDCLSLCICRHRSLSPEMVETIETVKANILKSSQVLTYIPRHQLRPADDIGGYDVLRSFVKTKSLAYTPEAESRKLDMPKGIGLVGVPGTGKSVVTETIASILGLPLVLFDFSAVFNSLVGESEKAVRQALKTVDALGGCVLVIDEADKALAGTGQGKSNDSGVATRVFGQVLTWLAKKSDRTFVVMTLNRTSGMPPELLRKGRFDEIFYVDLPAEDERVAIFRIHMQKRGVDPKKYTTREWKDFARASDDMVGAEIEACIVGARFAAFEADPSGDASPSAKQLLESIHEVAKTRVIVLDPDNINDIRSFAFKAKGVSSAYDRAEEKSKRSLRIEGGVFGGPLGGPSSN